MPTLPTNPQSIGASGHVNDHNTIVTALANGVYQTPSANQTITSDAATRKPLAIKAHASQSANLQEWQNSSGTALASVSSAGNILGGGMDFIASKSVSAASSGTLDGCFTSEYENYRLVIRCTFAASTYLNLRVRAGGTSHSSNNYVWAAVGVGSTAGGAANDYSGGSVAQWNAVVGSGGGNLQSFATFDLLAPQASYYTSIMGHMLYTSTGSGLVIRSYGGQMGVTTAFDGLEIYTQSGGNWTGIFSVYGYGS